MKNDSHAAGTYTAQEISDWISRYRQSGLGQGAFAKKHGLPRSRLHYWLYGRGRRPSSRSRVVPAVFQELKLSPGVARSNWAVEISLPTGLAVRFGAGASADWIGAVVGALPGPC